MFLSPLNEINGGCEKILPESGSFWSNLKFFRMMDFTAWNEKVNGIQSFFWDVCSVDYVPISLLGAMMSRLNTRSRIATYMSKKSHIPPTILRKIRVFATKTTKSKKLRIRNVILVVWWMWIWIQQIIIRVCGFVENTGALSASIAKNLPHKCFLPITGRGINIRVSSFNVVRV